MGEDELPPSHFQKDLRSNIYARTPYIMKAILSRNENTIKFFVENHADINKNFLIPKYGKSQFNPGRVTHDISMIGSKRVSPLGRFITEQLYAQNYNATIIEYLISQGAKFTPDDITYIQSKIKSYNHWPQLCEVLAKVGYSFDFDADFLYEAIKAKNADNVSRLLNMGVKPNGQCLVAAFIEANNIDWTKQFLEWRWEPR
jgi:hypothetical protein